MSFSVELSTPSTIYFLLVPQTANTFAVHRKETQQMSKSAVKARPDLLQILE